MSLLDIFKKKKHGKSRKEDGVTRGREEKKPAAAVESAVSRPKKVSGFAYRILKKPHVTEKASYLTSKNQYVFEVFPDANKNQIKEAVADVYGVDVVDVNIINAHPKRRRLGKTEGWSKGYKKAIVKIKEGQKIEVLPR